MDLIQLLLRATIARVRFQPATREVSDVSHPPSGPVSSLLCGSVFRLVMRHHPNVPITRCRDTARNGTKERRLVQYITDVGRIYS